MGIMKIMGILLMIVGAVLTFIVGSIVKGSMRHMEFDNTEESDDGDFKDLITMSTLVFKIIGFGIAIIGVILIFI